MDTQSSGADIIGATLGRRTGGITADEPTPTPRSDALCDLAARLNTENGGLDGLSNAIASLRNAARLTIATCIGEAAAVRRLETQGQNQRSEIASLKEQIVELHDEIFEQRQALQAETAKAHLLTVERDSLKQQLATQAEALAAHERANAELRAEIARQLRDLAAATNAATASAELHSTIDAARAAAVVRAELAEAELAAIAQRRRRQRDGKRRKRPATKQAA